MQEMYNELIEAFKVLDETDKREAILNELLYSINKTNNLMNEMIPVIDNHYDEDEFLNQLYSFVISLKEENAKLIDSIEY